MLIGMKPKAKRRGRLCADIGDNLKRKLTAAAKEDKRTLTRTLIILMENGLAARTTKKGQT